MSYPAETFFDIETLINVAQPTKILVVGDVDPAFLDDYRQQKELIGQSCEVSHVATEQLESLWQIDTRFDVAVVINLFEQIDKTKGRQVLSRLRDVLSAQYCVCLPLNTNNDDQDAWKLTELFGFALRKVADYSVNETQYALFKYNIQDYKNVPDWLNADNWANPNMWGKYWW